MAITNLSKRFIPGSSPGRPAKHISKGDKKLEPQYCVIEQTSRTGKWIIEIPDIPKKENFTNLVTQIIPEAIAECIPMLQRIDTVVQFVPDMLFKSVTDNEFIRIAGQGCIRKGCIGNRQLAISVSLKAIRKFEKVNPRYSAVMWALFIILHELFETDYWQKRTFDTPQKSSIWDPPSYVEAEHEQVANARVWRQLLINTRRNSGVFKRMRNY